MRILACSNLDCRFVFVIDPLSKPDWNICPKCGCDCYWQERRTDDNILDEYQKEMERPLVPPGPIRDCLLKMVSKIREHEPKINSGIHLCDYMMICDDDEGMEEYYGKDYFGKYSKQD
jgi:hypothetical protein